MIYYFDENYFGDMYSVEIDKPQAFDNVKVYASDPWRTTQPGEIKDLTIEIKEYTTTTTTTTKTTAMAANGNYTQICFTMICFNKPVDAV